MDPSEYRQNVCVVTLVGDQFLVVNLAVWSEDQWKFPQGGLEPGESPTEAALRELDEELSVTAAELIGVSGHVNRYDWPAETRAIYDNRFRGQEQRFVLVRLDEGVSIEPALGEVRSYRLIDRDTIVAWSDQDHEYFRDYNGSMPAILREFGL